MTLRIELGARFNTAMVVVKIAAALLVIVAGIPYVRVENWTPFMPFGFSGVAQGAAVVFFAVFGYDTLTTAAEEARAPQRDVPRAVLLSLVVALTLYIAMSLVLTGIVRYDTLDNPAPVATAFASLGLPWVAFVVSLAAVAGIASVMLAFLLACARIWFAMSRDGLLPAWFAKLHPRFQTPYRPTLIAGALTALVAALYPIKEVAELVNIGTLSAFVVICSAIIVLRRTRPDAAAQLSRAFRPLHAARRHRLLAVAVVAPADSRLGALRDLDGDRPRHLFSLQPPSQPTGAKHQRAARPPAKFALDEAQARLLTMHEGSHSTGRRRQFRRSIP